MGRLSEVFLAIEGGGSKGRAAVSWQGKIAARSLPAGLNPNDIGTDLLKERLEDLILPLLKLPGSSIGSLRGIAAIAGAGQPGPREQCRDILRVVLKSRCSNLHIEVTSDAEALLECFFARRDGIVLVAGTGSICLGVKHARRGRVLARAGGWGSYLDKGCGFRLGLGVLDVALKSLEGRGDRTPAVELLCKRYGLDLDEIPGHFLPVRREIVADLARIAFEASGRGDALARRLIKDAIGDLVHMTLTVADNLRLRRSFDLVISGGLFRHHLFLASFKRKLRRKVPSTSFVDVADPLACILAGCDSSGDD